MELFSKISQFGFGILSAAAMVFLFTTVPLQAAKQPKVDICHLDQDTGLFTLISVSQNAQAAHLSHGDKEVPSNGECNAPPVKVFARAYINIDGQPGYNAATDIVIAQVVDANGDDTLNAGDELELGAYPKSFTDLSLRGTFGASANPIPITNVAINLPINISVTAVDTFEFDLLNITTGEGLQEYGPFGQVQFLDNGSGNNDSINIPSTFSTFVSQPEGPVHEGQIDPADNDFINVEINLAGL